MWGNKVMVHGRIHMIMNSLFTEFCWVSLFAFFFLLIFCTDMDFVEVFPNVECRSGWQGYSSQENGLGVI